MPSLLFRPAGLGVYRPNERTNEHVRGPGIAWTAVDRAIPAYFVVSGCCCDLEVLNLMSAVVVFVVVVSHVCSVVVNIRGGGRGGVVTNRTDTLAAVKKNIDVCVWSMVRSRLSHACGCVCVLFSSMQTTGGVKSTMEKLLGAAKGGSSSKGGGNKARDGSIRRASSDNTGKNIPRRATNDHA